MLRFLPIIVLCFVISILEGSESLRHLDQKVQLKDKKSPRIVTKLVKDTKRIFLKDFPKAHNPSLIPYGSGFLLTFRYCPDPEVVWYSHIGVVLLDENLKEAGPAHLLNTRDEEDLILSQAEDARIFEHEGKIYVIYNDNTECINPSVWERRDIYIAEVVYQDGRFTITERIKLKHESKYPFQNWQKNWVPFTWKEKMLLIYSPEPHEVLDPDLSQGTCTPFSISQPVLSWKWGKARGGTPALLVDGEYLAFFHSSLEEVTPVSGGQMKWHYYMGAYTFSPEPPFDIMKATPFPISGKGFYTNSKEEKRVIYPGGFAISGSNIYLAYGKDDCEVWVATIDKDRLKTMLKPVR